MLERTLGATSVGQQIVGRVVFIIATSLAVGPFARMIDNLSGTIIVYVEGIIWVAIVLTMFYLGGKVLFGIPLLFGTIPADVETPKFD